MAKALVADGLGSIDEVYDLSDKAARMEALLGHCFPFDILPTPEGGGFQGSLLGFSPSTSRLTRRNFFTRAEAVLSRDVIGSRVPHGRQSNS